MEGFQCNSHHEIGFSGSSATNDPTQLFLAVVIDNEVTTSSNCSKTGLGVDRRGKVFVGIKR
jgi:hypothetical protein